MLVDDPKPPGPVELDQNISGTVTLYWTSSPDEKRDDRLHYMVSKRDSFKRTWRTVADNLFNNKFTVVNILPGREYNFRVFAKNDMGLSPPSLSPVFQTKKEKGLCLQSQLNQFSLLLKSGSNIDDIEESQGGFDNLLEFFRDSTISWGKHFLQVD